MGSDRLLVGRDLVAGRDAYVDEATVEAWQAKSYLRGDQTLVCPFCHDGDGVAPGTVVPLVVRKGDRGVYFTHPPGAVPSAGHDPARVWQVTGRQLIAHWARRQPGVVAVVERSPLADVLVRYDDGSQVGVELCFRVPSDEEWSERHSTHLGQCMTGVWLWASHLATPWIVARHGLPIWYLGLDRRRVSTKVARGHPLPEEWYHAGDLSLFAPHIPPCVGDRCDDIVRNLDDVRLTAYGLALPVADEERLTARRDAVFLRAEELLRRRAPVRVDVRPPVPRRPVAGRPEPRSIREGVDRRRCVTCGEYLDPLVYGAGDDRHILC